MAQAQDAALVRSYRLYSIQGGFSPKTGSLKSEANISIVGGLIVSQLLAVKPQQVVLGKTEATDGCVGFQTTMRPMPIVAM